MPHTDSLETLDRLCAIACKDANAMYGNNSIKNGADSLSELTLFSLAVFLV